jgi:hypothetical protein
MLAAIGLLVVGAAILLSLGLLFCWLLGLFSW